MRETFPYGDFHELLAVLTNAQRPVGPWRPMRQLPVVRPMFYLTFGSEAGMPPPFGAPGYVL